jgi:hypothetical protein
MYRTVQYRTLPYMVVSYVPVLFYLKSARWLLIKSSISFSFNNIFVDKVKAYLEQGGYYSASKHLTQMFAKVFYLYFVQRGYKLACLCLFISSCLFENGSQATALTFLHATVPLSRL